MAVELMAEAAAWLEVKIDAGEIEAAAAHAAREEFSGIFELFQDDDVLRLFDMTEPADAGMAGHSAIDAQMGVADQRIEAWFRPLWGVPATGYLEGQDDQVEP